VSSLASFIEVIADLLLVQKIALIYESFVAYRADLTLGPLWPEPREAPTHFA
jgi:hypothetical protein